MFFKEMDLVQKTENVNLSNRDYSFFAAKVDIYEKEVAVLSFTDIFCKYAFTYYSTILILNPSLGIIFPRDAWE